MRPRGIVPNEAAKMKKVLVPKAPTKDAVDDHNLKGHVKFEAWCQHCVRGRAQEGQHRRNEVGESKEVPTIAIDHMWMGEQGEEIGMPIVAGMDEESGSLIADVVPEKGRNSHAIKRLGERIDEAGYRRIILKSDDEPSIVALKSAAKLEGKAEVMMEESPVGDSPSNGLAENAVKMIQGLVRTLVDALEGKYGVKLPSDHPAFPWLV